MTTTPPFSGPNGPFDSPAPPPRRGRKNLWIGIGLSVVIVALSGVIVWGLVARGDQPDPVAGPATTAGTSDPSKDPSAPDPSASTKQDEPSPSASGAGTVSKSTITYTGDVAGTVTFDTSQCGSMKTGDRLFVVPADADDTTSPFADMTMAAGGDTMRLRIDGVLFALDDEAAKQGSYVVTMDDAGNAVVKFSEIPLADDAGRHIVAQGVIVCDE